MKKNNASSDFVHAVPTATGGEEEFVLEEMQTDSAWYALHKVGRNGRWFVRKELNGETRGKAVFERILRKEYELLTDLDHQNIVRAYRWIEGGDDKASAFEMQYVDGRTLSEFIEEQPSQERKIKVAQQLIDVVTYIHSKHVTHQDIKPSNILISLNGDRVKLIDFGLAHEEAMQMKLPAGTEEYIAPEVLNGGTADNISDLYSLGRVLLEMDISPRVNRLVKRHLLTSREQRIEDVNLMQQAFDKAIASRTMYWLIPAVGVAGLAIGLLINFSSRDKTIEANTQQPLVSTISRDTIRDTVVLASAIDSTHLSATANENTSVASLISEATVSSPSATEHVVEKNSVPENMPTEQVQKPTSPYGETKYPILDDNGRYKRVMDPNGIYFPIEHCISFEEYYQKQDPKPYTNGSGANLRMDVFLNADGRVSKVEIVDRSTRVAPTAEMENFAKKHALEVVRYIPAQDKDGKCVPYKTFRIYRF